MLTIPAGLSTESFTVNVEDDKMVENAETFSIILGSNLEECAVDQTLKVKNINIADNDCK